MDVKTIIAELNMVLPQQAIADAVGVSQPYVSRWLTGLRSGISYDTGTKLLRLRRKHAKAIAAARRAA